MYNSYFRPFKTSDKVRLLTRHYKEFGHRQRTAFEQLQGPARPKINVMVPQKLFQGFVQHQFPFDLSTATDMAECLDNLAEDCIRIRDVSLFLLEDRAEPIIKQMNSVYGSIDGVAVIDDVFTWRRELVETDAGFYPKVVKWSDDPSEVQKAKQFLELLRQTLPPGADQDALNQINALRQGLM